MNKNEPEKLVPIDSQEGRPFVWVKDIESAIKTIKATCSKVDLDSNSHLHGRINVLTLLIANHSHTLPESQWIKCSNKMPEDNTLNMYTYCEESGAENNEVEFVGGIFRTQIIEYGDFVGYEEVANVTHWQEYVYPSPPTKEGE